MRWTKQKSLAESFLAVSLQTRIKYHCTRYGPGRSFLMNRGWVTLNGKQIFSCSTVKQVEAEYKLTGNPWYHHEKDPNHLDHLHRQGIYSLGEFMDAIYSFEDFEIEEMISSGNPVTRALVFFDRRLGKRRLKEIELPEEEYEVVRLFYQIRCEAEGILKSTIGE